MLWRHLIIVIISLLLLTNGHVYEMFGNSNHYYVQPPQTFKPAGMPNKPLAAKYFIYDVVTWLIIIQIPLILHTLTNNLFLKHSKSNLLEPCPFLI